MVSGKLIASHSNRRDGTTLPNYENKSTLLYWTIVIKNATAVMKMEFTAVQ